MILTHNGNEYDISPHADLRNADLSGADLSGALLRGADLSRANLTGADLSNADLRNASLSGATLTDADLSGALLSGADFSGAIDGPCPDCCRSTDDCECYHCSRCGDVTDSPCGDCERCSDCCNCVHCVSCGDVCEYQCQVCDRGTECCCAGHDDEDNDDFSDTNPHGTHPAARGECARLAGVEYETTDRPSSAAQAWARKWSSGWHRDGSCGYEAVTAPAAGSRIDACITELESVIGDTDETCGIHVHVDARDYRWADTYRFLRVFAKVEPLLFVLGGQQRVNNQYCAPCGIDYLEALHSEDAKNHVLSIAYGVRAIDNDSTVAVRRRISRGKGKSKTVYVPRKNGKNSQRMNPSKKASGRYRSLNIAPWVFGRRLAKRLRPDTTFEFRLHRNGDSAERVIGWTHLCVAIVDWAQSASEADVAKLPRSALRALIQIAPASRAWILRRVKEWRHATRLGTKHSIRRIDSRNWTIKTDPEYRMRAARVDNVAISGRIGY